MEIHIFIENGDGTGGFYFYVFHVEGKRVYEGEYCGIKGYVFDRKKEMF